MSTSNGTSTDTHALPSQDGRECLREDSCAYNEVCRSGQTQGRTGDHAAHPLQTSCRKESRSQTPTDERKFGQEATHQHIPNNLGRKEIRTQMGGSDGDDNRCPKHQASLHWNLADVQAVGARTGRQNRSRRPVDLSACCQPSPPSHITSTPERDGRVTFLSVAVWISYFLFLAASWHQLVNSSPIGTCEARNDTRGVEWGGHWCGVASGASYPLSRCRGDNRNHGSMGHKCGESGSTQNGQRMGRSGALRNFGRMTWNPACQRKNTRRSRPTRAEHRCLEASMSLSATQGHDPGANRRENEPDLRHRSALLGRLGPFAPSRTAPADRMRTGVNRGPINSHAHFPVGTPMT